MQKKLATLSERLEELNRLLSSEEATADMENYRKITREHADITPVVEHYRAFLQIEADMAEAQAMLSDPEMKAFAEEEIASAKARLEVSETDLQKLLLPKDPNDERSIFLEIRAGTGGDESALFAGDLFRMYSRFAERQRWKVEVVSANDSELGGYREIIAKIEGLGAYSKLKFESGGHRVQRVPETEAQGRVHTSTITVAVMIEPDEEEDIQLDEKDLRIDTYRSSGAGGQHVNTTDSAVRITHIPTGVVAHCQQERSQIKNREKAMRLLKAKIVDEMRRKRAEEIASTRSAQVGTGDRSERIRTYNFPQNRVTDHRIDVTLYNLDRMMEGDLDGLVSSLVTFFYQKNFETNG